MKSHSIRLVACLGACTIAAIFIIQLYWLQKALDSESKQFAQTVGVALSQVSQALQQHTKNPSLSPVQEIASNYYVVPVKGMIDTSMLRKCLTRELSLRRIDAKMEYAIFDSANHRLMFGERISPKNLSEVLQLPMLAHGSYYLGISFPGKSSHIAGTMGIWFFSSFILLVIAIFYTYTLWVIFRQKKLSEVQKDFVNNMAHEFRTPLSTIALSADTLLNHRSIMESHHLSIITKNVQKEAMRLDTQVERILQMAQSRNGKIKLAKEQIDLHHLILEVSTKFKQTAIAKNKYIEFHLNAPIPIVIADRVHLQNVLVNLLDNSIKYSEPGKMICISTAQNNGLIHLSVADEGQGISFVHQKKIFDPFYRIPTGNVHNVRGYGLGLNYVKNIVKSHRWKIELISKEQEGAQFSIYFHEEVNLFKRIFRMAIFQS